MGRRFQPSRRSPRWASYLCWIALRESHYFPWKNGRFQKAKFPEKVRGQHSLSRRSLRHWCDKPLPSETSPTLRQRPTNIVPTFFIRCAAEAYSLHTIWILLWLFPAPWAEGTGPVLRLIQRLAIFL